MKPTVAACTRLCGGWKRPTEPSAHTHTHTQIHTHTHTHLLSPLSPLPLPLSPPSFAFPSLNPTPPPFPTFHSVVRSFSRQTLHARDPRHRHRRLPLQLGRFSHRRWAAVGDHSWRSKRICRRLRSALCQKSRARTLSRQVRASSKTRRDGRLSDSTPRSPCLPLLAPPPASLLISVNPYPAPLLGTLASCALASPPSLNIDAACPSLGPSAASLAFACRPTLSTTTRSPAPTGSLAPISRSRRRRASFSPVRTTSTQRRRPKARRIPRLSQPRLLLPNASPTLSPPSNSSRLHLVGVWRLSPNTSRWDALLPGSLSVSQLSVLSPGIAVTVNTSEIYHSSMMLSDKARACLPVAARRPHITR